MIHRLLITKRPCDGETLARLLGGMLLVASRYIKAQSKSHVTRKGSGGGNWLQFERWRNLAKQGGIDSEDAKAMISYKCWMTVDRSSM